MNTVAFLRQNPFTNFILENQIQIKKLGRPMPDLSIEKSQSSRARKFNISLYQKNQWICGCEVTHRLFCFPCLLFKGDDLWSENGTDDLTHIWEKMRTHEKSTRHINNVFSLAMLGKVDIKALSNTEHRVALQQHKEVVQRNRQVLDQVILCIRNHNVFDSARRSHRGVESPSGGMASREIIHFYKELIKDIREHLEKLFNDKEDFRTILNELLSSMIDVYQEEVLKQAKEAECISLIVDESMEISCKYKLVLILRYVCNGVPVERFWKVIFPDGYDSDTVAKCLLEELEPIIGDKPNKLISISYDGPTVVSGSISLIEKKIREKYPMAKYVHYYGHTLNLIISSAVSVNRQARIFYNSLCSMCNFISNSSEVLNILNQVTMLRNSTETQWNFDSQGVSTVWKHRGDLITVMDLLEKSYNDDLMNQAGGYKFRLQNKDFTFWLGILNEILPHVDVLFKQIQQEGIQYAKRLEYLKKFEMTMLSIAQRMDAIISNIEQEINKFVDLENEGDCGEPLAKKPRLLNVDKRRSEALEICNAIIRHINVRFEYSGHLSACVLLQRENFKEFRRSFPQEYLGRLQKAYSFVDIQRLKTELSVVYERPELRVTSGLVSLLSLFSDPDLFETYRETIKVLNILATTPMLTSESERCFPVLNTIKNFLRYAAKDDNLNVLTMLAVEKKFVNDIDDFNQLIIERFASKRQRTDFIYRKI